MLSVSEQTYSLISRTKELLGQPDRPALRQIAEGAGVQFEWLRKLAYTEMKKPNIDRVERVNSYLTEWRAAKRFNARDEERAVS